jgi:pimeloyl-ACP methyl ester carboxylesterase
MDAELPTATVSLHGQELHYLRRGSGPALVLIHGILGSRRSWAQLTSLLAEDFTVIAPDLLGHGDSAKPRGDYSLGAHAGRLRDLLDELGVERATLVGHSLGGGVALQFAWLFPRRCERLVLVASGGLGRELNLLLRLPALPGVEWLLPLVASSWLHRGGEALASQLGRFGMRSGPDLEELWRCYVSLGDVGARRAFLATIRTVVDPGGQTVSALGGLPALAHLPTLLVWGARDRLIPVSHGLAAQRAIPGSRLEVFEGAGHFPHLQDPARFAALLREFAATTA